MIDFKSVILKKLATVPLVRVDESTKLDRYTKIIQKKHDAALWAWEWINDHCNQLFNKYGAKVLYLSPDKIDNNQYLIVDYNKNADRAMVIANTEQNRKVLPYLQRMCKRKEQMNQREVETFSRVKNPDLRQLGSHVKESTERTPTQQLELLQRRLRAVQEEKDRLMPIYHVLSNQYGIFTSVKSPADVDEEKYIIVEVFPFNGEVAVNLMKNTPENKAKLLYIQKMFARKTNLVDRLLLYKQQIQALSSNGVPI